MNTTNVITFSVLGALLLVTIWCITLGTTNNNSDGSFLASIIITLIRLLPVLGGACMPCVLVALGAWIVNMD